MPDISFGFWVKERRKILDLTQLELAQRVGCSVITLQKIEAGNRFPSKQMAERIADQLGIATAERSLFVRFARMKSRVNPTSLAAQSVYRFSLHLTPTHATNLPAQTVPLIGRDREIANLRKRLLKDDKHLVTLVGPPGVGKTSLAIQVASDLLDEFEDGIFFISLATINNPALISTAIAQTLGVNTAVGKSIDIHLRDYLVQKHILLILDNFEQIINAAHQINDLLSYCPWLSLLITSRVPLHLRWENQFPVHPLELPSETEINRQNPAHLADVPAITLFIERAEAVLPDFALNMDNSRTISEICIRLNGLPLAIELVAAQIKTLPPPILLESISSKLFLHSKGFDDLSPRHQTLYNAIDWSYNLLDIHTQSLFLQLSVFVGGWTLQEAEKVVVFPTGQSTSQLDTMITLVNNHIIQAKEVKGELRFTMLEIIRLYAIEKLAASGDLQSLRQRHAETYLALAEEAEPHLRGFEQLKWLDRLEEESENLRNALNWFSGDGENAVAMFRLAVALGWFWIMRGYINEGHNFIQYGLKKADQVSPFLYAKALMRMGALSWPGDLPSARYFLEQSLSIHRNLVPKQFTELALTLTAYALVMTYFTDSESVIKATSEAIDLFQQTENIWGEALAITVEGQAYLLRHDYLKASARFEKGLRLFYQTGDIWGIGIPLCNWGYTDSLLGDPVSARNRIEAGILEHRRIGECASRAIYLNVLAQIVQQQGDLQTAARYYDESLELLRKMGLENHIAEVLFNLAFLTQSQGNLHMAKLFFQDSLDIRIKQKDEQGIVRCQNGLAEVNSIIEGSRPVSCL